MFNWWNSSLVSILFTTGISLIFLLIAISIYSLNSKSKSKPESRERPGLCSGIGVDNKTSSKVLSSVTALSMPSRSSLPGFFAHGNLSRRSAVAARPIFSSPLKTGGARKLPERCGAAKTIFAGKKGEAVAIAMLIAFLSLLFTGAIIVKHVENPITGLAVGNETLVGNETFANETAVLPADNASLAEPLTNESLGALNESWGGSPNEIAPPATETPPVVEEPLPPADENTTLPAENLTLPEENLTLPAENITLPETNLTQNQTENLTLPQTNQTENLITLELPLLQAQEIDAQALGLTKQDVLEYRYSDVGLTHSCSYYWAKNPTQLLISANSNANKLKIKNFVNKRGQIKSGTDSWEVLDEETGEYAALDKNDMKKLEFAPGEQKSVRFCAEHTFAADVDGVAARVEIDHIPQFMNFDYDEMAWWNASWVYKKQINVRNNNAIVALTNYTVLINPQLYNTTGLLLSTHFSEGDGAFANDLSGNNNKGTHYGNTVGLWHFDENTSTVAYDASPYGNNGTLNGNAAWASGKSQTGLVLDGAADYVDLANNINFSGSIWTFEFWFNFGGVNSPLTGDQGMIGKGGSASTANDWWIERVRINSTNSILRFQQISVNYWDASAVFTDNSGWHHAALVFNATNMTWYIDGIVNATFGAPPTLINSENLIFGHFWNRYYNGTLDEVVIYKKALSQSEIQSHYAAGQAKFADWTSNGRYGNAMTFDGSNDYASIADNDGLTLSSGFTVAMWINNSDPDYQIYASKWNTGALEYLFRGSGTVSDWYTYCIVYDQSAAKYISRADNVNHVNLHNGQWHHVVCTWDGTASSAGIKIYADGVQIDDTSDDSGSFVNMDNTGSSLYLGKDQAGGYATFNGTIDEVRIYNRSLSAAEISTLYNATKTRLDYGDVRFAQGNTELGNYLEGDNLLWFKVPSVSAGGTVAVEMYYGNPSADSTSNGDNTFLFFDDFDDGYLDTANKWTVGGGTPVENNGVLTVNSAAEYIGSKTSYGVNTSLVYSGNHPNVDSNWVGYISGGSSPFAIVEKYPTSAWGARSYVSAQAYTAYSTALLGTYHRYEIARNNGASNLYFVDGTLTATHTTQVTPNALPLTIYTSATGVLSVDYLFLKNYVSPEPTVYLGTLETSSQLAISQTLAWNNMTAGSAGTVYGIANFTNGSAAVDASIEIYVNNTLQTLGLDVGDGSDGALVVSVANTVVNDYAYLSGNESSGEIAILVNSASAFAAGDEIIIMQMQNKSGGAVGNYEFKDILLVNGSEIILAAPLANSYYSGVFNTTNATVTQIVRVPQYTDVIINSNANITAPAWDGYKGGVVVLRATGTINVTGQIDAAKKGYRGAPVYNCGMTYCGGTQGCAQQQGESYEGKGVVSTAANKGAGGGGTVTGSFFYAPGGGGGGYATNGTNGTAAGGLGVAGLGGGIYGVSSLAAIPFGSGGGGMGSEMSGAGGCPQRGGDGGGAIMLFGNKIIVSGNISANGEDFARANWMGGGGAGGSVYLAAQNITNQGNITAVGGLGGYFDNGVHHTGPSGDGGSGRIRLDSAAFTGTTYPGSGYNGTVSGTVCRTNSTGGYSCSITAPGAAGSYPVKVNLTYLGAYYGESEQTLYVRASASYTTFDGSTTNFNAQQDITNISQPVLEKASYGKIVWSGNVNAEGANLNSYVTISSNLAKVQSVNLDSSFNSSATITLYGLSFVDAIPYYDPEDDGTFVGCPASICTEISYVGGNFTFNVTHFSGFGAGENLTIGLGLLPSSAPISSNVVVSGSLNLTNGSSIPNNPIGIYLSGIPMFNLTSAGKLNTSSADWWNGNWKYRRDLALTNNNATIALTNYSVLIDPALYNTTGLVLSTHFTEGDGSVAADLSGSNNKGTHWGNTVGLWHFDENTSTIAYDASPYGNNGTITGAVWKAGKSSSGLELNGTSSDYVTVADNTRLEITGTQLSIEAWIKPKDLREAPIAGNMPSAGNAGYNLQINGATGKLQFLLYTGTLGNLVGDTALNVNQWYHVVGVYDGSNMKVYLNGGLNGTLAKTGSISGGSTFVFGKYSNGVAWWNGTMDEVAVYSKALTAAEVSAHYNAGKAKFTDWTSDGKFGNGLGFDGINDYANVVDSSIFDFGNGSFTISTWHKSASNTNSLRYIAAGTQADGANNMWFFGRYIGKDSLNFGFYNGAGYTEYGLTGLPFADNSWIHSAVTRSGANVYFYWNGVLNYTWNIGASTVINSGSTGLIIGARKDSGVLIEYWNGTLDEIKIYNRSLSAAEVLELYNATKTRLDYGDVRFSQNSTELSHWMEQDNKFWVKVPSVAAGGTAAAQMYYGNPSANATSNAENTLLFYDDFSKPYIDTAKWTRTDSGGTALIENGKLSLTDSSTASTIERWQTIANFTDPLLIEADASSEETQSVSYRQNMYFDFLTTWAHLKHLTTSHGWFLGANYSDQGNINQYQTYAVKTILSNGTSILYVDGAEKTSGIYTPGSSQFGVRAVLPDASGWLTSHNHYDNIKIRSYVSPEPTTSQGAEWQRTQTDSSGRYSYSLTAPSTPGVYAIKVNSTYLDVYAENQTNLTVFDVTVGASLSLSTIVTGRNVTVYGKVNLTDGRNVTNNPIGIYVNNLLLNSSNLVSAGSHSPGWWNFSWLYRKNFTITNNNDTNALANYSVSIDPAIYNTTQLALSAHFSEGDGGIAADSSGNNNKGTHWGNTVGLWHFDENTSTIAYDATPLGRNGTIVNGTWASGKSNYGISFNGSVNYVALPNDAFDSDAKGTFEAWVYPKNISQIVFFGAGSSTVDTLYMFFDVEANCAAYGVASPCASFQMYQGASTRYYLFSNISVPFNQWTHIAYAVDGTTSRIYINGVEDTKYFTGGSGGNRGWWFDDFATGTTYYTIGALRRLNPFGYWNGTIDEVAIYNKPLTSAEISAQYNASRAKFADWTSSGKFGNAMSLDGVNDYVDAGDPASGALDFGAGDFAVTAWAKKSTTTVRGYIINKMRDTSSWYPGYGIAWDPDNTFVSYVAQSGAGAGAYTAAYSIDTWHHVALVRSSGTAYFYVDGVQASTYAANYNVNNANSLNLGRDSVDGDQYFNGTIDEVRIYNRSLSATEVSELYNATKAKLDYSDVRFSQNSTELSNWMEADNKFWVKVPSVAAGGTAAVQMYYGNPNAGSVSNGTAAFTFFDDFNDDSFDKAVKWTSSVTNIEAGGTLTVTGGITTSKNTYGSNNALRAYGKFTTASPNDNQDIGFGTHSYDDRVWRSGVGNANFQATSANTSGFVFTATSGNPAKDTANHLFEILTIINSNINWYMDGILRASLNDSAYMRTDIPVKIFGGGNGGAAFDWILLRSYMFPEPTATTGVESLLLQTNSDGNYNYTFVAPATNASYTIKVNTTYEGLYAENQTTLSVKNAAIYNTFNGATTDFNSAPDITNVCQPILEKTGYGKIQWNSCVNAENANFDSYATLSSNLAKVLSSSMHPSFNSSANITLTGLGFRNPGILWDPEDDGTFIACPSNICAKLSYSGGNLVFNTTRFSGYSGGELPNVTLVSPADNTVTINTSLTFVADVSTSFNLTNVSLYTNINGSWARKGTDYFAPGNDNYTKSLLHFDGENGSTTITESARGNTTAHYWNAYGNALISDAQSVFDQSLSLDGSGDYLKTPYNSDWNLATGNFTIDARFRSNSFAGEQVIISKDTYGSNFDWGIILHNTTQIIVYTAGTSKSLKVNVPAMNTGQWYHVALVHRGDNNSIYLNGISYGSNLMNITDASQIYVTVGCASWNNPNACFNGSLDELRVSKGIARWNSTFALPTEPYSVEAQNSTFSWTVSGIPVGSYSWNVLAFDRAGQSDWGDANRTLSIIDNPPNVTLVSPENSITTTNSTLNFVANVSDDINLLNATLWTNIGGSWAANSTFYFASGAAAAVAGNLTAILLHFDEGTGNISYDSSGKGNNGTLTETVTTGNCTGLAGCNYPSCDNADYCANYCGPCQANPDAECEDPDWGCGFSQDDCEIYCGWSCTWVGPPDSCTWTPDAPGPGPSWNSSSKFGGYTLNFDGTNDYVNVPGTDSLKSPFAAGNITMSAWFNLDTVPGADTPVIVYGTTTQGYCMGGLISVDSSKIYAGFQKLDTGNAIMEYFTAVQAGQWYHVAWTFENSGVEKMYVNGVKVTSATPAYTLNTPAQVYNLVFGTNAYAGNSGTAQCGGGPYYLDGRIDDALIYNRTLSDAEILELYQGHANTSAIANFTVSNIPVGTYKWNAQAFDSRGQNNWSNANWTFTIQSPPITCPYEITVPGDYNLTQNINSSGTCITISAGNVTLDCQGYTINGTDAASTYGINNSGGFDNITIKNCIVANYGYGIYFANGAVNGTIINNTANSNSQGIRIDHSSNNALANNTAILNSIGISVIDGTYNSFTGNNASGPGQGTGFYFASNPSGSHYNVLVNNIANSNGANGGFHFLASSNNLLINNSAAGNTGGDFYSWAGSLNNTAINFTTQQNLVSFTGKDIALKGLTTAQAPADPASYKNISKYVNATNNSANSWLFLNMSYTDADISSAGVNESTLRIWKKSGSNAWTNESFYAANQYGVSTANKFVYANITNFSSTFAPLGSSLATAPTKVNLSSPANNSTTVERLPTFVWNNATDSQGDNITYELQLDTDSAFAAPLTINATNITEGPVGSTTNYTSGVVLDVDTTYWWRVRGYDGALYGDWSDIWNFTLQSYLAVSLVVDTVNFGSLALGASENTTDDSPGPFILQNDGNIFTNITVTATKLFRSAAAIFPGASYQFKVGYNESSSFNLGSSTTAFTNMTNVSSAIDIMDLEWNNSKDSARADLLVRVASDEPAGDINSTVTFETL